MLNPNKEDIVKEYATNDKTLSEHTINTFYKLSELVRDGHFYISDNLSMLESKDLILTVNDLELHTLNRMVEALKDSYEKKRIEILNQKKQYSIFDWDSRDRINREAYKYDKKITNLRWIGGNINFKISIINLRNSEKILKERESYIKNNSCRESIEIRSPLDDIVGLDDVKKYINGIHAQLKIYAERSKLGLTTTNPVNHMIFQGNPGTGKTTIARILVNLLFEMGVLKQRKLIEVDRSGLVAEYVGQTAIKTMNVINDALDGVLFIDEAYSLAQDASGGFGKEAIDTLVKGIEDNRNRLVVILAGYKEDMQKFLQVNPGLQSRFPIVIDFPDYSVEELISLTRDLFSKNDYILDSNVTDVLARIFAHDKENQIHFGNGRYVRNFFEQVVKNQALRLQTIEPDLLNKETLMTIVVDDLT